MLFLILENKYFCLLHNKSTNYTASVVVDLKIVVHSQFQPQKIQKSAALSYTLCWYTKLLTHQHGQALSFSNAWQQINDNSGSQ